MVTLTIIIPVFNTEKFLRQCIDSVVSQTFQDWELILIDDGSSDGSGAICDDYARSYSQIHVFHKQNGGVSSARNLGLQNAKGEWVTFIDADDFISPTFIEGLVHPISTYPDLDFIHGGCINWRNDTVTSINQTYDDYIGCSPQYVFNMFRGLPFAKLFRYNLISGKIKGNPILFDEKMKIAEDMAFTLDYLLSVNKYAFVSEHGYYYRTDNINSATRAKRTRSYSCDIHSFKHLIESTFRYINSYHLNENDSKYRLQQRGNQLIDVCISLYMDKTVRHKFSHLRNDFSEEELNLLKHVNVYGINSILAKLLYKRRFSYYHILMTSLSFVRNLF